MSKKRTKSYKQAITEIETILEKIEHDEMDIDHLTENVEKALTLIQMCKNKLHETETSVKSLLTQEETKE